MMAETLMTTITDLIAELTYRNYAHNRRRSPRITPEDWARIYPDAEAMERRFQEEEENAPC